MRGKATPCGKQHLRTGITPAYAGKREPVFFGDRIFQDHPRLCGEKVTGYTQTGSMKGSPPPMRGKVYFVHVYKSVPRITPAYAGKSATVRHMRAKSRDHPRLCGEKIR